MSSSYSKKINPMWIIVVIFIHVIHVAISLESTSSSSTIQNEDNFNSGNRGDDDRVIRMDLHPTSSYLRWLHQQLEELDSSISNANYVNNNGDNDNNMQREHGDDPITNAKEGGSLRRLTNEEWGPIQHGAPPHLSEEIHLNHEELLHQRQLIQLQLEDVVNSLKGAGAAYASVMEFLPPSIMNTPNNHYENRDWDGNRDLRGRHLKQSSQRLNMHNEGIQEYNDYYRRYSRHEWVLRQQEEGGRTDENDRRMQTDITAQLSLLGTSWRAVEIALPLVVSTTNTQQQSQSQQLISILPSTTLTLTFSSETNRISGTSGCNRYHSAFSLSSEERYFNTSYVGGTRMYCHSPEGVMEQESGYQGFLTGRRFYYEIVLGGDDAGEDDVHLVLLDAITRSKGHIVPGDIVGRFVPLGEETTESGTRKMKSTTSSSHTTTVASINIAGSSWMATEYHNGNDMVQVLPSSTITLYFEKDGMQFSGNTGCNDYLGSMEDVTISSFLISDHLAVTESECMEEDMSLQEEQFLQLFHRGKLFEYNILEDGSLDLTDGDLKIVMAHFVPHPDNMNDGLSTESTTTEKAGTNNEHSQSTIAFSNYTNNSRKLQQSVRAKKKGGMFNAYQTSPLHQGYGTHYATIWVGSPSQRKSVIIDTGSHFTAFPCKGCDGCGEEHHTDKYFDPEASSTFRALNCNECQSAQCVDGRCVFSQTYTEGSSWHAYEAVDKVFVGKRELSSALNPTNNAFKTDFLFGCQVKETGLFVTQLADGIMGMSAHPSTLPRAMYEQGKLEHNMFSMCFRRELHVSKQGIVAGMLTLGGIDTRVDFAPMVYARNVATSGWFTVFVKNVYIREQGGQHAKADGPHQKTEKIDADIYQMNSGKGVIIDSGTTDTYLHESIAKPFEKVWTRVTGGRKYSNEPVKMEEKDLLQLPTVLIQMAAYNDDVHRMDFEKVPGLAGDIDPSAPHDVILAIPATHYMEYSPSKGTYTPRIYFTETRGGVVGANAMQGHNVLFDWENKRVGFAESSCEYQEESKTVTDEGVMSVDCKLGAPSLSVSCSDSADLSRCEHAPAADNTALNGLEIWTRIVQATGTPQGLTCEEVSNQQNEDNGGGEMEVNCDGKGVCREVRKCVISCANAIAHGAAATSSAALSPIGSCGAVTWSACDYTCTQTKIDSVLMNDGKCHEERSLEETRPCHVQACGRSDPCKVPFVVHAIMKIRGAVASSWTKHAEEIFAEAFAATMNEKRKKDDLLFEPGDVVVLNASPWRASDDTIFGLSSLEGGKDEELGMQLVVETSIFNKNAELPPSSKGNGSKDVPLATCQEKDLQPLANVAQNIHKKLAQTNFVDLMVEIMKNDDALGEMRTSPFYYTFEDRKLAKGSQVVTSWTIKTDIGAGSSRIDFNAFATGDMPMNLILLTTLSLVTAYTCWSLRLWSTRKKGAMPPGQSPRDRQRGKYSRVNGNGNHYPSNENDSMVPIADDDYYDERSVMSNYDERSVMTNGTEYTQGAESIRSIGSLSTYLARTSKRGHDP